MIYFYSIFHLNLMYSSIEKEQRKEVIEKCYYPLLELAEKRIPIGIEATGLTLEIINKLDSEWISQLKSLINNGKVEFIGSGYAQIIGPLFPKQLNIKNQEIGLEIYKELLGITPEIALINEMAYSKGIVDIYAKVGYKAIVMEWNNQYRFHKEQNKNWRYYPQYVKGTKSKLPIIWADSIAFQKFQRYAHGEITIKEYCSYINSHNTQKDRFFPLYANDAEIFNFRPGRYKTEKEIEYNEWKRIKKLYFYLNKTAKLILPHQTLNGLQNNELELESTKQPIVVKKQEKYNINRWALTGRNDLEINTTIYTIYKAFLDSNPNNDDWKKLCYLASSDFRTHITEKRWQEYIQKLSEFKKRWQLKHIDIETHKQPFSKKETKRLIEIETNHLKVVFNKTKGMSVKELLFKDIINKPLIGTLPHGYYEDISLGADFFSFHSIIENPGKHKCTNLNATIPTINLNNGVLEITDKQHNNGVDFLKSYLVFLDRPQFSINLKITLPKRDIATIHPINLTFMPEAFDKSSLFYATNNGGDLEYFYIKDMPIDHSQSLSGLISAKYGLGATEGKLIIGDRFKQIEIIHNQIKSALIPYVYYKPIDNTFFLRIQYSACEIDDTFKTNHSKQQIECELLLEYNQSALSK